MYVCAYVYVHVCVRVCVCMCVSVVHSYSVKLIIVNPGGFQLLLSMYLYSYMRQAAV